MSNWTKQKISDLGFLGRGKSKHRPRNDSFLYGGKYPFIQTSDVKHVNFYINSYSQTYNENGLKQSKLWQKDTLCITIAANIAETALLSFPACFPDSVVGFISDPAKSNVHFIKYSLDLAKKRFQDSAKGTAQDNLSLEKIESIKLDVPDIEIQNTMASILSAYDYLIENSEKRIKILEEMAQLLYTEWFVKFKFPGHERSRLIDSGTEYGQIPEGWEVKKLGDVVKVAKGKNITKSTISLGNVPVVAGGLGPAYYHNKANTTNPIVTISASGANAGFVNLYLEDIWASDCSYIDMNVTRQVIYYYLFLKNNQHRITLLQHGAAQPHVYPADLMRLLILCPPEEIVETFNNKSRILYQEIGALKTQNKNLTETRDLLIPQLVTGRRELK